MSKKKHPVRKAPVQRQAGSANLIVRDAADTRKFLKVLAIGTFVLLVFMYIIYSRMAG